MTAARVRSVDEARAVANQALPSFVATEIPEGGTNFSYFEDWSIENIAGELPEGGSDFFAGEPIVISDVFGRLNRSEFAGDRLV